MNRTWIASVGVVLAALLSLGGLAASVKLLEHHALIEVADTVDVNGDPLFEAICEVAENSSCDEVLRSDWGKVAGAPLALWGVVFFASMTSWFIVVGQPAGSLRWLHGLPVAAAAVGTTSSLFLEYVMWFRLESWCPFCLTIHVLTAVLLIVTIVIWPRREAPAAGVAVPDHPSRHLVVIAVVLAVLISAVGWGEYRSQVRRLYADGYKQKWEKQDKRMRAAAAKYDETLEDWQLYQATYQTAYQEFLAQEWFDIPVMLDDPVRGPADAPHTVVLFTDFQCPWCRGLSHMLEERRKQFPGKFRLVFKYFPMNRTCNKHIKNDLHSASCAAARVAEVSRIIGGNGAFWDMHDALFAQPKKFGTDFVKRVAGEIGVDNDEFWTLFKRTSSWQKIYDHVEQGHAIEVKGTPALFFDGRRMKAWGDEHTWRFMLETDAPPPPSTTKPATQPG